VTESARDRVRAGVVQGALLGLACYVSFLLSRYCGSLTR
jgi:hypothetical protein